MIGAGPMVAILLLAPAGAMAAEICVSNRSGHTLLFVAEIAEAVRARATLADDGKLCVVAPEGMQGVVSVFRDEEALEGCSRLAATGTQPELLRYADFDNCAWHG